MPPQLLLLRGIYEMLPIQLYPICIYMRQLSFVSTEAHRVTGLGANPQLTKKAAAAIPTPAARTEVMLDGFSALG